VTQLAQQAQTLLDQEVKVVLVQVTELAQKTLDQWLSRNEIPFQSCSLKKGAFDQAKRPWGVQSLPWLILTDRDHVVVSEGFQLGELDDWLEQIDRK
jgi:hypothetical protein